MRHGFTLVELSIVLVIIGLLAGGIVAGQALIRGAEIRAVVTESQRYVTGINNFRDKYQAIPGDFADATTVWGKSSTYCNGDTGSATANGTCNGDGNGVLSYGSGASTSGENFQFWKQLALAGMIEGNYTGIASTGGSGDSVLGSNVPASRVTNAGWGVRTVSAFGGDANSYAADYGTFFEFGSKVVNSTVNGPLLTPTEAFGIDTKLDDGLPAKGKVMAVYWSTCTTSTSSSDYSGIYKATSTASVCALYFPKIVGQ